jgi:antitoxin component of RelBE/YafQ-DinJ toxin-antitoxin module
LHPHGGDCALRLSRAIDILLENAAHNQNPPTVSRKHSKEKLSAQISDQSDLGVRK